MMKMVEEDKSTIPAEETAGSVEVETLASGERPVGRFKAAMAGWGSEVFTAANGWWWVPIVAPCVGAVAGGWIYDLCVGHHFPE